MKLSRVLLASVALATLFVGGSMALVHASDTGSSTDIAWSENAGGGTVFPACGSATPGTPTCQNGTGTETVTWNGLSYAFSRMFVETCSNVSVQLNGSTVATRSCDDSYTFTGLNPNQSYACNIEAYGVNYGTNHTSIDENDCSFTTPNCPPAAPAPVCNLTALPTSIDNGDHSKLSWTTTNATTFSIDHGVGNIVGIASGYKFVYPTTTTTYTGTATGPGGTTTCAATVAVDAPPPAPTCTLSASPTSITSGDHSTLSWTTSNATSVSIDHSVGAVSASGSTTVTPTSNTSYTLTASGAGGSVTCGASVAVSPPPPAPTCTLVASPTTIVNGDHSKLSWTTTNATTFSIDHGVGNIVGIASGYKFVYPTATTLYTGTATGPGGTVTCSATVTVTATQPPDLTAGAVSPASAVVNQPTTLSATISNAATPTGAGFTDVFEINPNTIPATFAVIQSLRPYSSVALAAGASNTASASYTFASSGTWYVRACADTNTSNVGAIAESNEDNNCGPWTSITIVPSGGAPSCTLSGSGAGKDLTLSWTSSGATTASVDQSVGSVSPVASGSKITSYPDADTIYTMTVTGPGGTGTCSTKAKGGSICEPTATNSCTVCTGPSCTACTTTCCGSSCVGGTPSISCSRSPSDNSLTAPATVTYTASPTGGASAPYVFRDALNNILQSGSSRSYVTTYNNSGHYAVTVGASNVSGTASCGTALTVVGGGGCGTFTNSITANPTRLATAGNSTISWEATGVTSSCVITGTDGYTNTVTPPASSCSVSSGPGVSRPITTQTTYCITCDGNTAAQDCVTVNINSQFQEF